MGILGARGVWLSTPLLNTKLHWNLIYEIHKKNPGFLIDNFGKIPLRIKKRTQVICFIVNCMNNDIFWENWWEKNKI